MAYDFEFYQGKGTGVSEDHKDLGLGGSIVMRLVEKLPERENFKVYFDNFFTSIPLLIQLKEKGFHALGVLKTNRMSGAILKPKGDMKRQGRGAMDSFVSKSGNITIVRWQDNNVVNVVFTFFGMGNIGKVKRWRKKNKAYIDVDRPEIIKYYNDFMGRVDLMGRLISYYSMTFRTKRWSTRVILYLLSMSLVNSWIEYRERELKKGVSHKLVMDLLSFREELADSLCKSEVSPARFRGRPSMRSLLNYTPIPRKKTPASVLPTVEVRHDGFDHWPEAMLLKSAQTCRLEHCGKSGRIRCQKCNVYLCLTSDRNCFHAFHTNK